MGYHATLEGNCPQHARPRPGRTRCHHSDNRFETAGGLVRLPPVTLVSPIVRLPMKTQWACYCSRKPVGMFLPTLTGTVRYIRISGVYFAACACHLRCLPQISPDDRLRRADIANLICRLYLVLYEGVTNAVQG
jgi:hypothetical protein